MATRKSFKDNPALQFITSVPDEERPERESMAMATRGTRATPKEPVTERRTRRVQLVLAPSVYERALEAFESRRFKSLNDYISTLIENDTEEQE